MASNPHAKHRERERKEFLEHGFNEATPPHKILEMLLFYSIPRKDTNEIAHKLLDRFGSIKGIIDAPEYELMKIDGVGENTVSLLKLIMPVASRYISAKSVDDVTVNDIDQIGTYLIGKHLGFSKEVSALTSFNSKGRIIGFDIINEGDSTLVELSVRKVIEVVMRRNPAGVVLSHNHPNGFALPSREDIDITVQIREILSNINVELIDHIIVVSDDFVSLKHSEYYKRIFVK